MHIAWLLLVLAGCGGAGEAPEVAPAPEQTEVSLDAVAPTGWETRFRGAEPWTPDETQLAALYEACPTLRTVRATRETEDFWRVEVEGEALDAVDRVGALLPDDNLADAVFDRSPTGGLVFPVACEACTLVLGLSYGEDRWAACTGPSRSIRFESGAVE